MRDVFVLCALVSSINGPRVNDEFPPASLQNAAQQLPRRYQEQFINIASARYLCMANHDCYDWNSFAGVYNIIWRRSQGRPFPYPIDDEWGARPPKDR